MKATEISKDFLLEFEKNRGKGRKKKGSRDGNPQPTTAKQEHQRDYLPSLQDD